MTEKATFAPRPHIALAVKNVEESTAFYAQLFNAAPTKERPGYSRFEPAAPALHLALNQSEAATPAMPYHFGIHVEAPQDVRAFAERMQKLGCDVLVQERTACCYAEASKAWATDPDGHKWEIFARTADESEHYADTPLDADGAPRQSDCCDDAQANVDAGQSCCAPAAKNDAACCG